jgi:ATP-dependent helicase/nuclease subunit A
MKVRVAGAGTGKTTSLVRRYLALVAEGVPLRRVAGVTYTRASAAELRQRVGEGVHAMLEEGEYLGGLERLEAHARGRFEEAERELGAATITTIHGFMRAAIRLVAPALALDPDFTSLGEWEAEALFADELAAVRYLAAVPGHEGLAAIVRAAGEGADERALALFAQRSSLLDVRPVGAASTTLVALFEVVFDRYRARLGPASLAPSEVEREALRCVTSATLARRVAARYPVVLVDEFQDVNPLQGAFFEGLEGAGARVEVVGDPKQSIYGFRFADVEVFRRAAAAAKRTGSLEPPLVATRRHARRVAAFLNHMTAEMAQRELGFASDEAPPLEPAGDQAEREGSIECHWWRDEVTPLPELRRLEAAGLASRLASWHERGMRYADMALLARSRAALSVAREALEALGIPATLRQGRGFFERLEVRDLYHAVRVALEPSGASLAAFLRGPFAALPPAEVERIVRADDPLTALEAAQPAVLATYRGLRARVLAAPPVEALARIVRDPLVGGGPYVASLDARGRDNVDALLLTVAQERPSDPERLLDRLARLVRDTEAGDVPQSGAGVQLLTLHASKGLEWPLVAVFDAGGGGGGDPPPLVVDPAAGVVAVKGDEGFEAALRSRRAADEAESYRQLYVALSRARDVLLLTGSHGRRAPSSWLRACNLAGIGPSGDGAEAERLGVLRSVSAAGAKLPSAAREALQPLLPAAAPWSARTLPRGRYPDVVSPSWVRVEGAGAAPPGATRPGAPRPLLDEEPARGADAAGSLPGRGSAVGTLVHEAIARGWRVDREVEATLAAQEVLWPFPPEVQRTLVVEALELLGQYHDMLADGRLPPLGRREEDRAELPFAFPDALRGIVWQGVIDRLYRVDGTWLLDDYKTDRTLDPAHYDVAMAAYVEAVEATLGVRPSARLVDLRRGRVLLLDDARLRATWARRHGGATT